MTIRGPGYHLWADANWTQGKREAEESRHAKEGERTRFLFHVPLGEAKGEYLYTDKTSMS